MYRVMARFEPVGTVGGMEVRSTKLYSIFAMVAAVTIFMVIYLLDQADTANGTPAPNPAPQATTPTTVIWETVTTGDGARLRIPRY
jgi:hypothetical protein